MVSAKNEADQFITNLLDPALVEKVLHRQTMSTKSIRCSTAAGIAWQGVEIRRCKFHDRRMDSLPMRCRASPPQSKPEMSSLKPGGQFIAWLKGLLNGNDAHLEGKIPMPKGDPRRLPDGSILPMPTSDPRNQIPNFPDDRGSGANPGSSAPAQRKADTFAMPDPRDEGESWSPPPVDTSAAAPRASKVDVEVET